MSLKQWVDSFAREPETVVVGTATGSVIVDGRDGLRKAVADGLSAEQLAEYQRVAAKVGFAPRGLKSDALRQFLRDEGISVYASDAVKKYLDQKYGKEGERGATWVWKPFRTADGESAEERSNRFNGGWGMPRHSRNGSIGREQSVYGKPVPLPVLLTVERILDKFPDAHFYVSDEYTAPPIADPFLAVVYGEDSDPVVIERWDEPTFRP